MIEISKIKVIKFHIKKLKRFDEITSFRLKSLAAINVLFALIGPLLAQYYNLLSLFAIQAASVIAFFGILKTVAQKFVRYLNSNTSFSILFKILVFIDIFYALGILLYFVNVKYMIWFEMISVVIQLPFLMAYSNALNNFITYFYKDSFTEFQNYRADLNAESSLLGLILSIILSLISIKLLVIVFSIGLLSLSFYQLRHIKDFEKYDFKYMYRYKKSFKRK